MYVIVDWKLRFEVVCSYIHGSINLSFSKVVGDFKMSPSLFFVGGFVLVIVVFAATFLAQRINSKMHNHKWVEIDRWDTVDESGYYSGYNIVYQCTTCKKTRKEKVRVD